MTITVDFSLVVAYSFPHLPHIALPQHNMTTFPNTQSCFFNAFLSYFSLPLVCSPSYTQWKVFWKYIDGDTKIFNASPVTKAADAMVNTYRLSAKRVARNQFASISLTNPPLMASLLLTPGENQIGCPL